MQSPIISKLPLCGLRRSIAYRPFAVREAAPASTASIGRAPSVTITQFVGGGAGLGILESSIGQRHRRYMLTIARTPSAYTVRFVCCNVTLWTRRFHSPHRFSLLFSGLGETMFTLEKGGWCPGEDLTRRVIGHCFCLSFSIVRLILCAGLVPALVPRPAPRVALSWGLRKGPHKATAPSHPTGPWI